MGSPLTLNSRLDREWRILTRIHEKNPSRGLGRYVMDMFILIAYDSLRQNPNV